MTEPSSSPSRPAAPSIRIVTGLWQIADQERAGATDLDAAAEALAAYARDGFDAFDMADHYGSAELIAGRRRASSPQGRPARDCLTKWCPTPGPMTPEVVRAGVERRARAPRRASAST